MTLNPERLDDMRRSLTESAGSLEERRVLRLVLFELLDLLAWDARENPVTLAACDWEMCAFCGTALDPAEQVDVDRSPFWLFSHATAEDAAAVHPRCAMVTGDVLAYADIVDKNHLLALLSDSDLHVDAQREVYEDRHGEVRWECFETDDDIDGIEPLRDLALARYRDHLRRRILARPARPYFTWRDQ